MIVPSGYLERKMRFDYSFFQKFLRIVTYFFECISDHRNPSSKRALKTKRFFFIWCITHSFHPPDKMTLKDFLPAFGKQFLQALKCRTIDNLFSLSNKSRHLDFHFCIVSFFFCLLSNWSASVWMWVCSSSFLTNC